MLRCLFIWLCIIQSSFAAYIIPNPNFSSTNAIYSDLYINYVQNKQEVTARYHFNFESAPFTVLFQVIYKTLTGEKTGRVAQTCIGHFMHATNGIPFFITTHDCLYPLNLKLKKSTYNLLKFNILDSSKYIPESSILYTNFFSGVISETKYMPPGSLNGFVILIIKSAVAPPEIPFIGSNYVPDVAITKYSPLLILSSSYKPNGFEDHKLAVNFIGNYKVMMNNQNNTYILSSGNTNAAGNLYVCYPDVGGGIYHYMHPTTSNMRMTGLIIGIKPKSPIITAADPCEPDVLYESILNLNEVNTLVMMFKS